MLQAAPEQRVRSWPGPPAALLVLLHGREQRHAAVVPGAFWWGWVHFHFLLFILWWILLHWLRGLWHEDEPVTARDCPNRMPSVRHVLGPGRRTRGSPCSTLSSCALFLFIACHGSDTLSCFMGMPGSPAVLQTMGVPGLRAAVSLMLLLRVTTAPMGRPRPPVTVRLRGWPVPLVAALPPVPPVIVHGLCSRGLLSTGVSCAAGAIPRATVRLRGWPVPLVAALPPVPPVIVHGLCARHLVSTGVSCAGGAIPHPMRHLLPVRFLPWRFFGQLRCSVTPRKVAARLVASSPLVPRALAVGGPSR